ncbi:nuclear transport factor 2 family protein [Flavobacterium zepuense]|uniref:Nuclear transport factor 2 family protein n=1 Tax=Flavobacterium zepuense TaxID=2593302 RepID=A0A552VAQ9_9FLAO|nr:nuclear transport factor 2 family protein [Flavobacterium zepuense]TRW27568.1 nuclear transport factor 2 family protein [Flavobacterium zepuense]
MDIKKIIEHWFKASNAFDTEEYFKIYDADAVLEDTTIGETYHGHHGIRNYFEEFFIGYNTKTEIIDITFMNDKEVYINAIFDGNSFSKLKGVFELTFSNAKIIKVKCYLK